MIPPRSALVAALLFGFLTTAAPARAEPGWSPVILPTGAYRQQIKSMPIHLRPYRPFHFYGNNVRRAYYRSNSPQSRFLPPRDYRRRTRTTR